MIEFIRFKRGQQQAKYIRLEPQFEGNAFLPRYALVPLAFRTQTSGLPLVSIGESVNEGQMREIAPQHMFMPRFPVLFRGLSIRSCQTAIHSVDFISKQGAALEYWVNNALRIYGSKAIRQD